MSPPAQIGPYAIVRELGRGGMGAVYEVHDPRLDRRLALKLNLSDEPSSEARFLREAELMARVQHPNVVRIVDHGRIEQGPFLVTDLVPGQDLKHAFRDQPADPEVAARLVRDLADALETVHAAGILHRDLKPANVILTPDGRPVLLDFGIARDLTGEALTRTGTTVGTAAYMSPEQAGGISPRQLNARTDVYGLGAVLLFLLSSHAPFTTTGVMALVKAVMLDEPEWPTGVPPALDGILRKAMAKERLERYPSAAALRDDLDRYLRGEAPRAAPPRRRRGPLLLGVAALLALAGGAGWAATRDRPAPSTTPSASAAAPQPSPTPSAPPTPAALPPERLQLVHDRGDPGAHTIAFLPNGELVSGGRGLTEPDSVSRVVRWSPDGRRLGEWFLGNREVEALATTPRGEVLVATTHPTDNMAERKLLRLKVGQDRYEVVLKDVGGMTRAIAVEPGGARAALVVRGLGSSSTAKGHLLVVDLATGRALRGGHDREPFDVAWRAGRIVSVDGRTGEGTMGVASGQVSLWDPARWTGKPVHSIDTATVQAKTVAFVRDDLFAVGTTSWRIYLLSPSATQLELELQGVGTRSSTKRKREPGAHNGTPRNLAWDAPRQRLYSVSGDRNPKAGANEVRAWDLSDPAAPKPLGALVGLPRHSEEIEVSPDGETLAIGYLYFGRGDTSHVDLIRAAAVRNGRVRDYATLRTAE